MLHADKPESVIDFIRMMFKITGIKDKFWNRVDFKSYSSFLQGRFDSNVAPNDFKSFDENNYKKGLYFILSELLQNKKKVVQQDLLITSLKLLVHNKYYHCSFLARVTIHLIKHFIEINYCQTGSLPSSIKRFLAAIINIECSLFLNYDEVDNCISNLQYFFNLNNKEIFIVELEGLLQLNPTSQNEICTITCILKGENEKPIEGILKVLKDFFDSDSLDIIEKQLSLNKIKNSLLNIFIEYIKLEKKKEVDLVKDIILKVLELNLLTINNYFQKIFLEVIIKCHNHTISLAPAHILYVAVIKKSPNKIEKCALLFHEISSYNNLDYSIGDTLMDSMFPFMYRDIAWSDWFKNNHKMDLNDDKFRRELHLLGLYVSRCTSIETIPQPRLLNNTTKFKNKWFVKNQKQFTNELLLKILNIFLNYESMKFISSQQDIIKLVSNLGPVSDGKREYFVDALKMFKKTYQTTNLNYCEIPMDEICAALLRIKTNHPYASSNIEDLIQDMIQEYFPHSWSSFLTDNDEYQIAVRIILLKNFKIPAHYVVKLNFKSNIMLLCKQIKSFSINSTEVGGNLIKMLYYCFINPIYDLFINCNDISYKLTDLEIELIQYLKKYHILQDLININKRIISVDMDFKYYVNLILVLHLIIFHPNHGDHLEMFRDKSRIKYVDKIINQIVDYISEMCASSSRTDLGMLRKLLTLCQRCYQRS